jgi:hypothetical protein
MLAAARAAAEAVERSGAALPPGALVDLIDLLRRQSLSALDCFGKIAPQLQTYLGRDAYARVSDFIDNLQFTEACGMIEAQARIGSADLGERGTVGGFAVESLANPEQH